MRVNKVQIVVGDNREIRIRLPSDFPLGAAGIIVLSDADHVAPQTPDDR